MRSLVTRSFVHRFPSLPMMPKGDGQRKARSEWSLPVHQTFLGEAEAVGPAVRAVTARRREVPAEAPQRGDGHRREGGGGGGGDEDREW